MPWASRGSQFMLVDWGEVQDKVVSVFAKDMVRVPPRFSLSEHTGFWAYNLGFRFSRPAALGIRFSRHSYL
jgi:hypothetical protein